MYTHPCLGGGVFVGGVTRPRLAYGVTTRNGGQWRMENDWSMMDAPAQHQFEEQSEPRGRLRVVRRRGEPAATLDGPRLSKEIGPLELELGGRLEQVTVAYRTWGRLNAAGDNAVIVLHALTGDSQAGGSGGWWEPLIGPGRALDTDQAFVICANILGGCQGTTGPASDGGVASGN